MQIELKSILSKNAVGSWTTSLDTPIWLHDVTNIVPNFQERNKEKKEKPYCVLRRVFDKVQQYLICQRNIILFFKLLQLPNRQNN